MTCGIIVDSRSRIALDIGYFLLDIGCSILVREGLKLVSFRAEPFSLSELRMADHLTVHLGELSLWIIQAFSILFMFLVHNSCSI